jgi:hypothetical protein
MEWPSLLFALFNILPAILQRQQNVPIDISIRSAPKIPHTSLLSVPVHILECPYKWEKRVPVKIQSS